MEKIICGIKFDLPKNGAKLLEQYLEDVKKYIKDKKLNDDLYNDIENRIAEKLSGNKEITDINIINLLNDLGDVEEIFGQENNIEPSNLFDEVKGKYSPLLLGVFSFVANKYNINVWIIRIVYIFLVFSISGSLGLGFIWFLLNFIVYVAVGVKLNKEIDLKGGFKGVVVSLYDFIRLCFSILWKIIKFLFKNFFIFAFIFFSLFFGICALTVGPLFLVDVNFQNQLMFINISPFFTYGSIIGGLVLCVLGSAALLSLFSKKLLNTTIIFVLIGMGFLSLASIFFGGYKTLSKYSTVFEKSYDLDLGAFTGTLSIDKNITENGNKFIKRYNFSRVDFGYSPLIELQKSKDSNIHAIIRNAINSDSQNNADSIFNKLNPVKVGLSGSIISIGDSNEGLFKEGVPFSFLRTQIIIQLPESVSLDTTQNHQNFMMGGTYSTGYFTSCSNALISFDKKEGMFFCSNPQSEIDGCKNYLVSEKNDCLDYLNSFEITKCKSILSNLTGDFAKFNERQIKDYKYCNAVLTRKKIKTCNAILSSGTIDETVQNYEMINYCRGLQK